MWGDYSRCKTRQKHAPYGMKMAQNGQFWAKNVIFDHKWPKRPPIAGKSGTNGGSQWNTCGGTSLDAKLVRNMHPMVWKWPKNGQFWAKNAIFGHMWPQRLQMAGKSGSKCGSQWNTCGGTTLVAKLVGKMHPMVWKWPKNGQYWAKNAIFGHKWPQRPPVAGKSGTNGGSE